MDSLKEMVLHSIATLPVSATLDDIMERLYFVEKIHQGQEEVEAGKILTLEQVRAEIKKW